MSGSWSFSHAQRVFWRFPTPRIFAVAIAGLLTARVIVGGFSPWELLILPALLLVHPLTEWLIHVFLLHWRPRRLGPLSIDPIAARDHRAHHRDPDDLPLIFIPLPTLASSTVIVAAAWLLLAPGLGFALSGILLTTGIALAYEWVHFVCHVPYTPTSRFLKARVRHHRLHHYKNEAYWFGVTLHMGDRLLGTLPDPSGVPRSPTARALHGLDG